MTLDWQPLLITFKLASVTTAILFCIGVPFAWWLAHTRTRFKPVVEALVSMPLVLPPSVLGFYLLLAFSPEHWFGQWLDRVAGLRLAFSFEGLVVASVIFSFPFLVHPVQSGFQNLPSSLAEAAHVLGKSKLETFLRVLLPNIKPALLSGTVLAFAHTVGEFGVVLMIGGNLPDQTRVASIAIYDEVEALNYAAANFYAGVLFCLSFLILLVVYVFNRKAPI
ncbi:MAG TPA: molybdate ABC transporter permease subunit [Novimethylophilus sp.]|jgi:molybdate transport system permease protein|uniref:molybdate ABC transporter permease subunit n=1 Tax=Novimethylophilus sp. TaxID=2137426 RepID=UPI002F3FFEBD